MTHGNRDIGSVSGYETWQNRGGDWENIVNKAILAGPRWAKRKPQLPVHHKIHSHMKLHSPEACLQPVQAPARKHTPNLHVLMCTERLSPSHTPWSSMPRYHRLAVWCLEVLHKHLFLFLPLCFPSAALLHERHVLHTAHVRGCVCSSEVWEDKQHVHVHHRLPGGRLLLEGACLSVRFADQLPCKTDRFVLSAVHTETKEMERGKRPECLRTTRELTFSTCAWVWPFKTFTFVSSLRLPHTLTQHFIGWPNVRTCSTFQSSSHRWNRTSFSLLTSVRLYFKCDGACVRQHHPPAQSDELLLLVFHMNCQCANLTIFSEDRPSCSL